MDGGVTSSVAGSGTVDAHACGLLFGSKALYGCGSHVEGEGVRTSVNSSNGSIPQVAGALGMGFDICM